MRVHRQQKRAFAFTLVELLVVIGIIGILASILIPALARSKARAQAMFCLNNAKNLTVGWIMYADDHNGRLVYNVSAETLALAPDGAHLMELNWANNVLDWTAESTDNTNAVKMVATGMGPYVGQGSEVYRCPADYVLSDEQEAAGWRARVRSYSMNAMVGDPGDYVELGVNPENPDQVQFFTYSSIRWPAGIFVFVEEHPDSIDDASFLNQPYKYRWLDVPSSSHEKGGSFAFADGHVEMHRWRSAETTPKALPGVLPRNDAGQRLAITIPKRDLRDFYWITSRMSVDVPRD